MLVDVMHLTNVDCCRCAATMRCLRLGKMAAMLTLAKQQKKIYHINHTLFQYYFVVWHFCFTVWPANGFWLSSKSQQQQLQQQKQQRQHKEHHNLLELNDGLSLCFVFNHSRMCDFSPFANCIASLSHSCALSLSLPSTRNSKKKLGRFENDLSTPLKANAYSPVLSVAENNQFLLWLLC